MQAEQVSPLSSLRQKISAALATALSQASTSTWQITCSDEPGDLSDTSATECYRGQLEGSLKGAFFLLIPKSTLAGLALNNPAVGSGDAETTQPSALKSVVDGFAPQLQKTLANFGEISVVVESMDRTALPPDQILELWAETEVAEVKSRLPIHLMFSSALMASMKARGPESLVYPNAPLADPGANLDLVMDVELNVTLRFGQRQLALRDILELASGSVVELDRLVDEPVELILDGRVIARGEAVIIDGNYGMRVTEVLQHV